MPTAQGARFYCERCWGHRERAAEVAGLVDGLDAAMSGVLRLGVTRGELRRVLEVMLQKGMVLERRKAGRTIRWESGSVFVPASEC